MTPNIDDDYDDAHTIDYAPRRHYRLPVVRFFA